MKRKIALVVTLALIAAVAPAQGMNPSYKVLAGVWGLNRSKSDLPRFGGGGMLPPAERGEGGRGIGARGGGMGGRGGHSGGMGREGRAGNPEGQHSGGPFVSPTGADSFMIAVKGEEVTIVGEDGRVRKLYLDGRTIEQEKEMGKVVEQAVWKDEQILITTTPPGGRTVNETISLADDGSGRLVHTLRVEREGGDEPMTARFVYDKVSK